MLPGLFTVNLDPAAVMDEYVRHVVKLEMLVRRILDSPIYHRFFAAAPGLKELMVLGKIMVLEEARARLSHKPLWDLIVVDAPATGHGLAFLKVPLAASAAVPVGPGRPQRPPRARDAARPRADRARRGRDPGGDGGRRGAAVPPPGRRGARDGAGGASS